MTRIAGKGELKVLVAGVGMIRVLNKSQRRAKFTSFFTWTRCLLFFENYPPPPQPKPEINDVCVLFKHSNFRSTMLEMYSKRPRSQNFSEGHAPGPPFNSKLRFQRSQVTSPFHAYFKAFILNYYVSESWLGKMNGILHSDWLPEWARWGLSCPFMISIGPTRKKLSFWPYNKSFIDQASSVMMAE